MKRVIIENGSGIVVEKKSRFIASAISVNDANEAVEAYTDVKKKYFDAKHNCYAYICGDEGEIKKFSDDGEPGGTAGMPLLSIIEANNLTNVLLVVTRYFGGVLLGTGGLVRAYSAAGEAAIADAKLAISVPGQRLLVMADYANENTIRHIFKQIGEQGISIKIIDIDYTKGCFICVECEEDGVKPLTDRLTDTFSGSVTVEKEEKIMILKDIEGGIEHGKAR